MKKIFAVLTAVVLLLLLCACDKDAQDGIVVIPKGTYKPTGFSAGGEVVEGEDALGMFKEFSIVILDEHRAEMGYGEQKSTVEYTLLGDEFSLSEGSMKGAYKEGKISLSFGDGDDGYIVFEKVD